MYGKKIVNLKYLPSIVSHANIIQSPKVLKEVFNTHKNKYLYLQLLGIYLYFCNR